MQQHDELDALILSEVRKKRTTTMTLIIWNLIYGNKPNIKGEKKKNLMDLENRYVVAKGEGRSGMDLEFGISRCKL